MIALTNDNLNSFCVVAAVVWFHCWTQRLISLKKDINSLHLFRDWKSGAKHVGGLVSFSVLMNKAPELLIFLLMVLEKKACLVYFRIVNVKHLIKDVVVNLRMIFYPFALCSPSFSSLTYESWGVLCLLERFCILRCNSVSKVLQLIKEHSAESDVKLTVMDIASIKRHYHTCLSTLF